MSSSKEIYHYPASTGCYFYTKDIARKRASFQPCGHDFFHLHCYVDWFNNKSTLERIKGQCPFCPTDAATVQLRIEETDAEKKVMTVKKFQEEYKDYVRGTVRKIVKQAVRV